MTTIATLITGISILALLLVNRDPSERTSPALWLVVAWVAIATSRPVSAWLQMAPERSADQYLEGSLLDRNIFLLLLGMGLIVLSARPREVAPLLRSNRPLILFFSYCAVSVLWSDFPDVAFRRWIKAVGDVVMILVVLTERDPSVAIKRLFVRTAFVFVPLSVLFIRYYADLGRQFSRWEGAVSYNGVAVDKNMLGMACLIFGLALFWQLLQELSGVDSPQRRRSLFPQRSRSIFAHGLVLAMLVWLLVTSNSMTSLGCFVLASGLMIALSFPKISRKRALVHVMVVVILAIVAVTLFVDIGGLLLQRLGRDRSLTGRTDLWEAVLAFKTNPLLGAGFETFFLGPRLQKIWDQFWWQPNSAHNGYLEVYLSLGWIGVGLLALVAIKGYRNILKMLHYDPVGARLRLAYFVVALAYNLTESAFKTLQPVWLVFLLAVIVVPQRSERRTAQSRNKPNRWMRSPQPAGRLAGSYRARGPSTLLSGETPSRT